MKNNKNQSDITYKNNLNLFQTLLGQMPEMSLRGNREIVVEGSKGVLHYSEDAVRINTSIGLVCMYGRNLNLKCISVTELIVDGFITKIEFVM